MCELIVNKFFDYDNSEIDLDDICEGSPYPAYGLGYFNAVKDIFELFTTDEFHINQDCTKDDLLRMLFARLNARGINFDQSRKYIEQRLKFLRNST